MSDMKDLYKVYSAVHSPEIKDEITNARDGFSEMNLSQITDSDLQDIAEEIIEGMFGDGFSVDDSISIIKSILSESLDADQSNFRISKIDRINEGFDSAFSKVLEKSSRVAIESFTQYRKGKQLTEKWSDRVSHDVGNERIHAALIAEDRMVIVSNLLKMIEDFQESRDDKEPPSQFEKGDDDRGNPDYMKTSSLKDEEKWERLQNMRKKSKKASVRDKAEETDQLGLYNSLIESGKFSDEEIEKIVEAQVARNDPEKYEREQDKKLERDKPYAKRSKAARMADPERGINSPAFKKFMQQQGM